MVRSILEVLAWVVKNVGVILGIGEAVVVGVVTLAQALAKAIAGILSATPTKEDDWLIPKVNEVAGAIIFWVNNIFNEFKRILYTIADILCGRGVKKL